VSGRERILVLSRDESRRVDADATRRFGIPSIVLMENAARQAADAAIDMLRASRGPVLVCCGPGNNGGDGTAAARHLAIRGFPVTVLLCADPERVRGDARTNLDIARRLGIPIVEGGDDATAAWARACEPGTPTLVIDALLGTGATRPVEGPIAVLIGLINASGTRVLALDTPSGLDVDTGEPLGDAVRGERTVTFVAHKLGFVSPGAQTYLGEVTVADIGAPVAEGLGAWAEAPPSPSGRSVPPPVAPPGPSRGRGE